MRGGKEREGRKQREGREEKRRDRRGKVGWWGRKVEKRRMLRARSYYKR